MAEVNHFCSSLKCISPATHFYFGKSRQEKVCSEHLPAVKCYPIEAVFFITSPEQEQEYLARKVKVDAGTQFLDRLTSRLVLETETVTAAIEIEKQRCLGIVTAVYDMEIRKTKQTAHCVELRLKEYYKEFSLYLKDIKKPLYPASLAMTVAKQQIPSLLITTVWGIDMELSNLISQSLYRDELDVDSKLQAYLDQPTGLKRGRDLLRQSQELSRLGDWRSLNCALMLSQESNALMLSQESNRLNAGQTSPLVESIQVALGSLQNQRILEISKIMTKDAKCVSDWVENYNRKFPKGVTNYSEEVRKEKVALLEATLELSLPYSISQMTADLCVEMAYQHYYTNPSECEAWYQQALGIYSAYFPNNIETTITYLNLGNMCKVKQQLKAAEENYLKALSVLHQYYQYSIELAITMTRYAETLEEMGKDEEARINYQHALDIMTNSYPDSPETAVSLISAGKLNVKLQQFKRAEKCFLNAISIRDRTMPNRKELAEALGLLGDLYANYMYLTTEGESKLLSALNLLKVNFPTSKETANAHLSCAKFYLKTVKSISEKHYKSAVSILLAAYPSDKDTAQACLTLARFYQSCNSSNACEEHFKLAVSILQRNYQNDAKTMYTLAEMGRFYMGLKRMSEAEMCLQDSLTVANADLQESDDRAEVHFLLGEVMKDAGRTEDAIVNYMKGREIFKANDNRDRAAACLEVIEALENLKGRETITVTVSPEDLVETLKSQIHTLADVPIATQVITSVGGIELSEDRNPLSSYQISANDQLNVGIFPQRGNLRSYTLERSLGDPIKISARLYDSVASLKESISTATGIQMSSQRVITLGEEMEDGHTLAYYNASRILHLLLPGDITVRLKTASGVETVLTTNTEETVAGLKAKALEKCYNMQPGNSRLRCETGLMEGERMLSYYHVGSNTVLFLDKIIEIRVEQTHRRNIAIDCYFFDAIADVKRIVAEKTEAHPDSLRLYWRTNLLSDEQRIGPILVENILHMLQQDEIVFTVCMLSDSEASVILHNTESLKVVKEMYSWEKIKKFTLNGALLSDDKSLSDCGITIGSVVETEMEIEVTTTADERIFVPVHIPAVVASVKSSIQTMKNIPVSNQRLFVNHYNESMQEVDNTEELRYRHRSLFLLKPDDIVIQVQQSDKTTFDLAVSKLTTVKEVKAIIHRNKGIDAEMQHLSLEGVQLSDSNPLRFYNIDMRTVIALYDKREILVTIVTSDRAETAFLTKGSATVKHLKSSIRDSNRFWFKYSNPKIALARGGSKLESKRLVSYYKLTNGDVLNLTVENEVVITIKPGDKPPFTSMFLNTDTVRKVKESFSWCIEATVQRRDKLFHDKTILPDDISLAECNLGLECELEYLGEYEEKIVYIRKSDGEIININLTESDTTVVALKRRTLFQTGLRLYQQTLLFKGRILKDSQRLSALGIDMWSIVDLVIVPEHMLIWVKLSDNSAFCVGIRPQDSVLMLKSKIAQHTLAPATDHRLLFQTIPMSDSDLLSNYRISTGNTILALLSDDALVYVNRSFSSAFFLALPKSHSFSELKARIERKTGLLRRFQRLFVGKTPVKSTVTIESFAFSDYLKVDVVLDLKRRTLASQCQ